METAPEQLDIPHEGVGDATKPAKRKRASNVYKPYNIKPNLRQRKAVSLISKHNGNVGAAMREAGYPESSSKQPQRLTNSKAYKELIEEFLPDQHLLDRHREMLDAPRIMRTYVKGIVTNETTETDPSSVKALDMAYKLKGKYTENVTNNVLIVQLSDTSASRFKPIIHETDIGTGGNS